MNSLENADPPIEPHEEFPVCLFYVSRKGEADIVYPSDIEQELDVDEGDIPVGYIVHSIFPQKLRKSSAKFFAIVFQGTFEADDLEETDNIIVLFGAGPWGDNLMGDLDFMKSEIILDEGEVHLEPWEWIALDNFPDLVLPYRQAVTLQG